MAAKKAVKKVTKKTAPKKAAKKIAVKPAVKAKKTMIKKVAPSTPAPKPVAAPPVAVSRPTVPVPVRPLTVPRPVAAPAAVARPVAAPLAKPKVSKPPKDLSVLDYRQLRKYTAAKLVPFTAQEFAPELRAKIGSEDDGSTIAAWELVKYLEAIEGEGPDWKSKRQPPSPDGVPRKRGRPSKAEIAARSGVVQPSANPAAALANGASGKLLPPRPGAVAVPQKPLFKIPRLT